MPEYLRMLKFAFLGILGIALLFGVVQLAVPQLLASEAKRGAIMRKRIYGIILITGAIAAYIYLADTFEQLGETVE